MTAEVLNAMAQALAAADAADAADVRLRDAATVMLGALQVTSANLSSLIAAQHHDAVLMTEWRTAVDAAIALATGAPA